MNFSRYDKYISESPNNKLLNETIVEGAMVNYFNIKNIIKIEKIDYTRGIVIYSEDLNVDNNTYRWWDYFMDANCFVLPKNY